MKFLMIAALAAVAVADYHDDTFHFSTLGGGATLTGSTGLTGLTGLRTSGLTRQSKQYTVQSASPAYSSFSAQPAYTQQYSAVVQPAYTQQYSVKQVSQPAVTQKYSAVVQPAYTQQYSVKQVAQPAVTQQYSAVVQPTYTQQYSVKQVAQPAVTQKYSAVVQPAYTQQYAAVKEVAATPVYAQQYSALSASSTPQLRILSQVQESDPAGPYKLSYSTENGIQVSEQGALSSGAEGAVVATQGSYSYTGPDGQVYTVNWVADENGYRASGAHLPVSPPIPAEILKSLEEISRSGNKFDEQGRLFRK